MTRLTFRDVPGLTQALEDSIQDFLGVYREHPGLWLQRSPGKWSAGQQADHIARTLALYADSLEAALQLDRSGSLPPRPRRGPFQWLLVRVLVYGKKFPTGGKATTSTQPGDFVDRESTLNRIPLECARVLAIGAALEADSAERFWFPNPLLPRYHYDYPEILKLHEKHTRHHAAQLRKLTPPGAERAAATILPP